MESLQEEVDRLYQRWAENVRARYGKRAGLYTDKAKGKHDRELYLLYVAYESAYRDWRNARDEPTKPIVIKVPSGTIEIG